MPSIRVALQHATEAARNAENLDMLAGQIPNPKDARQLARRRKDTTPVIFQMLLSNIMK
jgi:hypothetical protein